LRELSPSLVFNVNASSALALMMAQSMNGISFCCVDKKMLIITSGKWLWLIPFLFISSFAAFFPCLLSENPKIISKILL
jgi:hypothetical protein